MCVHNVLLQSIVMSDAPRPTIRESPPNINADLIHAVNLTCSAEGSPATSYQWHKDGVAIPGETRAYLYIEETAPEDRGNYTCVASNTAGGRVESQPARLTIPGNNHYTSKIYKVVNSIILYALQVSTNIQFQYLSMAAT